MATTDIEPGGVIVELPNTLLITTNTADKAFNGALSKANWPLTEHASLALFVSMASSSESDNLPFTGWQPYISLLPTDFTAVAINLPETLLDLLPGSVREVAERQRKLLRQDATATRAFLKGHGAALNEERFKWGWLVGSFMPRIPNPPKGTPTMALAPFLDMLNHTPTTRISAGSSVFGVASTKTTATATAFRITTHDGCRRGREAFINYGPHDNSTLLAEYGFVVPGNPYDSVTVDEEVFGIKPFPREPRGLRERIFKELKEQGLLGDYTLRHNEECFRLTTTLRLLSCLALEGPVNLTPHLDLWRSVLHGRASSMTLDIERIVSTLTTSILDQKLSQLRQNLLKLEKWKESGGRSVCGSFCETILNSAIGIVENNLRTLERRVQSIDL
ncbi:SET domain-containing protein 4 [Dinochytrium kinnereticum]|nr:SET domain-containing protein 4 [Dinochytrium kinnereticum]